MHLQPGSSSNLSPSYPAYAIDAVDECGLVWLDVDFVSLSIVQLKADIAPVHKEEFEPQDY